jgi:hypothetical protein
MTDRPSAEELTRQAEAGLEAGQRTEARTLLQQAIRQESQYAPAWLALAQTDDSLAEQRVHLKRVLEIEPQNAVAQAHFEALTGKSAYARPPSSRRVDMDRWDRLLSALFTGYWVLISVPNLFSKAVMTAPLNFAAMGAVLLMLLAGLIAVLGYQRRWGVYLFAVGAGGILIISVLNHGSQQNTALVIVGFILVIGRVVRRWNTLS